MRSSGLVSGVALALAFAGMQGCQTSGAGTAVPPTAGQAANVPKTPAADPSANSASATGRPSTNAASPSGATRPAEASSPGLADVSGKSEFSTRHAVFQPVEFLQMPNWQDQKFDEALLAFKRGCAVLVKRPLWTASCLDAEKVRGDDPGAVKGFFEKSFDAYQVKQKDRSESGSLTGYFEPLLKGSRERKAPFVHPVYETPSDLYYLDAKDLEAATTMGESARFRIEDRQVKLIEASGAAIPVGPRVYKLSLRPGQQPETRDRKFRVRLVGTQLVGYATRQEIEASGKIAARPIAWVESAEALYAMQVQGSGRILLSNGSVIRVAYAEQNGHPFLPRAETSEMAVTAAKTRGFSATPTLAEPTPARKSGARKPSVALPSVATPVTQEETIGSGFYGARFSAIKDPSYVFFREVSGQSDGPIGAMGIALTPERSVAVDPRVTPLGAPVMIASRKNASPTGAEPTPGRLMVAQDTGGAIRGAVRADYFWGFGRTAGTQALRTNSALKMWVLLPKAFKPVQLQASVGGPKTRGMAGSSDDAECLVPDEELCRE